VITVIAPHARPEFSANLLANFRRQRGVEARLLVVENGAAVGVLPPGVCEITTSVALLESPHQSDAMNAGLAWLGDHGGGPWARFDDDDWYGPDYLASVKRSLVGDGVVVSGMPWRFVMLDDGLHQFTDARDVFTGGTLAANTADVALFERYRDDDLRWCRAMRERGARFVEREPWGYCYDRTTRLAPRVVEGGSAATRFGFGSSLFYGPLALSAVDDPGLQPLRSSPGPTDDELVAEMSAAASPRN
jgi:hypothetical protein